MRDRGGQIVLACLTWRVPLRIFEPTIYSAVDPATDIFNLNNIPGEEARHASDNLVQLAGAFWADRLPKNAHGPLTFSRSLATMNMASTWEQNKNKSPVYPQR